MNLRSSSPRIIGIIPARHASTRFPAKMLTLIEGKTLIQRTYENARLSSILDDLIIATDHQEIFDHIISFGGKVVMTCPSCKTGTDRLAEAVRNNPEFDDVDIILNIQGDEPCLDPKAIEAVGEALRNDPTAVMSTAITPLLTEEEANNPSVVKCVVDKNFNALYFSRALIPAGHTLKIRPNVPYYRHVGLYGYRRDFLLEYAQLPVSTLQQAEDLEQLKVLEHGFRIKTALVECSSIGVDTPNDIKKVEKWLNKQNTSSLQVESVPL